MRRELALMVSCLLVAGSAASAAGPCPDFTADRQPFFGDLHVHTANSIDAFVFDVVNTPRDAYEFARGGTARLTPIDVDRNPLRTWRLRRPLDFAAVTDHAEGFGATKVCTTPGTLAYDLPECQLLRGIVPRSDLPNPNNAQVTLHGRISRSTLLLLIAYVGAVPPNVPVTCRVAPEDCDAGAVSIWQDEQDAAAQYDDACNFTTFVAYEWTAMPGTANLHRNVIFRNEHVPGKAISYYDTVSFEAPALWKMLTEACLDPDTGVAGCDVLTIPHNSNLSAGLMFPDPKDAQEAADRAVWEPLVEITQHKGASECRFDKFYGSGTDTRDELCAYEQEPALTLFPIPGPSMPPPPALFPRRSFVRNVLKDGIALEQRGFFDHDAPGHKVHVNPFKLGIIGSTDTHNGTPGNTDEVDWPGHGGNQDDDALKRMSDGGLARANPGGLAVVWAEENTRESIFKAMRRRETYGTSGTRPKVRFFGGWDYAAADLCADQNLAGVGYAQGVPMGSDLLPRPEGAGAPRFIVKAMKDEGVFDPVKNQNVPGTGTPLQRIQIIKGWVDRHGKTHEKVFDVAGAAPAPGPEPTACEEPQAGASDLCNVWTDPHFDASEAAFYYARVLEEPTCRWSTYACQSLGIDPFAADCTTKALTAVPGQNLLDCCPQRIPPLVQERAWTSPIWYKPSS